MNGATQTAAIQHKPIGGCAGVPGLFLIIRGSRCTHRNTSAHTRTRTDEGRAPGRTHRPSKARPMRAAATLEPGDMT